MSPRNRIALTLIGAVSALATAQSSLAAPRSVSPASKAATTTTSSPENLPVYGTYDEDWLMVADQGLYLPVIDELGRHLRDANMAANSHEPKAAAMSLRRASTYLRSLPTVDAQGRAALEQSARDLDALAHQLDRGVIDAKRLANAYRRAYEAEVTCYWAHVSGDDWHPISRRSTRYLERAVDEFPKDPRAAADDLRKARAYLRLDELRHSTFLLRRSERKLAELGNQVDEGKIHDVRSVEDAAADAEHALAQMHYERALMAWKDRKEAVAKAELRETADHLTRAAKRANGELKAAADSLERETRRLVSEAKTTWSETTQRVEQDLEKARDTLRRLGHRITQG
jgi:hypothetical protein